MTANITIQRDWYPSNKALEEMSFGVIYRVDMDFNFLWQNPHNLQLLTSAGLGALFGLERELAGKDPSLRTFSLICLGSCIFSIISLQVGVSKDVIDPGRIAAQIVVGIGFLGAGTIYRSRTGVSGLTTAALMWVTAAIGMAVGFGMISEAVAATIIALSVTVVLSVVHRIIYYLRKRAGYKNQSSQSE